MSAYLSISELVGTVFPTGRGKGILLMLRAYFDDSGTHDDSEIVAVGGLIGNVAQWTGFEREWTAKLADPLPGYSKLPLKMFHLSHCNARDGEFAGYTAGECDAVMHDFRQILIDSSLIGTASMIDKRAWEELVVGRTREWMGNAVDVCVENCLSECMKIAGSHSDGDIVAAIFDRGIWTPRLKRVTEGYTLSLDHPRLVSVAFCGVKDILPLQGADGVATENYWYGIKILRNGVGAHLRPHMRHYLDNMFAEGFIIDRVRIVEMLPELDRAARALSDTP